jgi:hypothetical protein
MLQAHVTVSDTILTRLAHGAVDPEAEPVALRGQRGGLRGRHPRARRRRRLLHRLPDLVPVLRRGARQRAGQPDLAVQEGVPPVDADLAFIGLVQPLGAIMPIAEEQGRLVADKLTGRYALPSRAEMEQSIAADDAAVRARYMAPSGTPSRWTSRSTCTSCARSASAAPSGRPVSA